jgi:hypothetical protein
MALLSDQNRIGVWARLMRMEEIGGLQLAKPELRAAVDAIDDWLDANSAAMNAAIPQPARGALTTKQKAALLMLVIAERYKL